MIVTIGMFLFASGLALFVMSLILSSKCSDSVFDRLTFIISIFIIIFGLILMGKDALTLGVI